MQRQETPPQCVIGPQAFKDTLYGNADTGWLTIFYTPSRRTLWFPVTNPVPNLDLEQNCYLGIGIRQDKPVDGGGRGKVDDISVFPAFGSTSITNALAPIRRGIPCRRPMNQSCRYWTWRPTSRP